MSFDELPSCAPQTRGDTGFHYQDTHVVRGTAMLSAKRLLALATALLAGLLLAIGFGSAAAQAAPYTNQATCALNTQTPPEGASVTLSCSGFGSVDRINIVLHTATISLGSATTNSAGAFSRTLKLPAGVTGQHTIVSTDTSTSQTASVSLTIGGGTSGGGGGGGGGGLSNTGVAVIGIGALGVVLLAGGGMMLYAGRRRSVRA